MNHENHCKCAHCESIAAGVSEEEATKAIIEWQDKCLAERGFYVHMVGDDPVTSKNFNAHSHGLQALDNHLDFQIVLPLPPKVAHNLICILADRVKAGEKFSAGQIVEHVVRGMNVKLVEVQENDRNVLRVILPDADGKVEPDEIFEEFAFQYEGVPGVSIKKKPWVAQKLKKRK
jgi:hypothetical protein